MSNIEINANRNTSEHFDEKFITIDMFGLNYVAHNDRWDSFTTSSTQVAAGSVPAGFTYDDALLALRVRTH